MVSVLENVTVLREVGSGIPFFRHDFFENVAELFIVMVSSIVGLNWFDLV
jgi:hypothetical protein